MRNSISLVCAGLLLAACGKSEPPAPAPAPTPMPVQTAPAPAPEPMAAPTPAASPAPEPMAAPAPAAAPAMAEKAMSPATGSYVVMKGDTVYGIAKAHGVSPEDVMKWNNIDDPQRLFVGKALKLSASGN